MGPDRRRARLRRLGAGAARRAADVAELLRRWVKRPRAANRGARPQPPYRDRTDIRFLLQKRKIRRTNAHQSLVRPRARAARTPRALSGDCKSRKNSEEKVRDNS